LLTAAREQIVMLRKREENMEIDYFLRKPIFPLICDIEGNLLVAKSKSELIRKISKFELDNESKYDIIDITGEGWKLDCHLKVISPFTFPVSKKRWSKRRLIDLYNTSHNSDIKYSTKSLSTKRYEKVFMDLVELISKRKSST
jgi:hypothetical protein